MRIGIFASKDYYVVENNQVIKKNLKFYQVFARNFFNQHKETHLTRVVRDFQRVHIEKNDFQANIREASLLGKIERKYSKELRNKAASFIQKKRSMAEQKRLEAQRVGYYTFEKIDERFGKELERLKTLPQFSNVANFAFNDELKTRARELAINAKEHWPLAAEIINQKLQAKMQGRLPDEKELSAKLYGLALRVQLEAFLHTTEGILPQNWEASKGNKQAPHTKLFGNEVKLHTAINQNPNLSIANQRDKLTLVYGRTLGEGSYNIARNAYHIEGGGHQLVARELKIENQEPGAFHQWVNEVKEHKKLIDLKVPGIVKAHVVYAPPHSGKKAGMILERYDGDLRKLKGNLDEKTRISVAKQIFTTLIAMHEEGFSHEDLKLENIFFKKKPGGEIETGVGDFGFLSRIGEMARGPKGNLMYSSIESLFSNIPISPTKDCWAAGLMAYELKYNNGSATLLPNPLNERYTKALIGIRDLSKNLVNMSQRFKNNPEALISQIVKDYPCEGLWESPLLDAMYKRESPISMALLRNEIIKNYFYPQVESVFNDLGDSLKNGDEYDRMVADLLRPDPKDRISLKEALARIS